MLPLRTFLRIPRKPARLACCSVFALCAGTATANDTSASSWKLSGFGTLGAVHANTDLADFSSSIVKASGAGASGRWSTDVDTRLGAQLDIAMARQWSAVLQVVSEQRYDNSYRPQVEWANVKYQPVPDLTVRIGRMSLPVYMAAEHRKVGYVYSAVRQPLEVAGGMPITTSDGADLAWRWRTGDVRHITSVQYGYTSTALSPNLRLRARDLASLAHSIDVGSFSARASIVSADVTIWALVW